MKSHGITPRSTRCPKCHGHLFEDEDWIPPEGYDQHLHRFRHRSAFKQRTCGAVIYKMMMNVPTNRIVHLRSPRISLRSDHPKAF
jgi:hypothetical protein